MKTKVSRVPHIYEGKSKDQSLSSVPHIQDGRSEEQSLSRFSIYKPKAPRTKILKIKASRRKIQRSKH
ncbi:Uncharacterized protein TCM_010618 [Theobroma cacao]|uniref:Uncharacterized protein n=1 Tax=Theobroma cacao TaxID=3641 RepID=A0A061EEM3_THECC|nr:Uncharacterized protein TCM_010618 [Theobroma cacao]